MGVGFSLALVAVGWRVYRQRAVASRWVVWTLMGLRVLAILAVGVLMLRPTWQWTQTMETAGTLWLMLDQSGSMGVMGPGRLRGQSGFGGPMAWGLLPGGGRESRLDVLACG